MGGGRERGVGLLHSCEIRRYLILSVREALPVSRGCSAWAFISTDFFFVFMYRYRNLVLIGKGNIAQLAIFNLIFLT